MSFVFILIIQRYDLVILILASTIPSTVDNGYCTKNNCTNDTLAAHIRNATQASTILPEEAPEEAVERSCDTLFMCIVTTLNKGLRNGGGIGDVLRQPSNQVSLRKKKIFFIGKYFI
jgi:inositol 1,4,5-triphosphate receptor type 2